RCRSASRPSCPHSREERGPRSARLPQSSRAKADRSSAHHLLSHYFTLRQITLETDPSTVLSSSVLDRNLPNSVSRFLRSRNANGQNAMATRRLRRGRVEAAWQRDRSSQRAVSSPRPAAVRLFFPSLVANVQRAIANRHIQIARLDARHFGANDHLVFRFFHIEVGRPTPCRRPLLIERRQEEAIEQAVDVIPQRHHLVGLDGLSPPRNEFFQL